MRIVQLEYILLRQVVDIAAFFGHKSPNRGLDGCGNEEILLLEPEFFPLYMVVAGIKDLADRTGNVVLFHRLLIIAFIKGVQMEDLDRFGIPDPQGIDETVAVTDNRHIVRNSLNLVAADRSHPDRNRPCRRTG